MLSVQTHFIQKPVLNDSFSECFIPLVTVLKNGKFVQYYSFNKTVCKVPTLHKNTHTLNFHFLKNLLKNRYLIPTKENKYSNFTSNIFLGKILFFRL